VFDECGKNGMKSGNQREADMYSGERLSKGNAVFEVLGTLDELCSWLGIMKASLRHGLDAGYHDSIDTIGQMEKIQACLGRAGGEIATSKDSKQFKDISPVEGKDLDELDSFERAVKEEVDVPRQFITPGKTLMSARIDLVRTVSRRLERRYVTLLERDDSETNRGRVHNTYILSYMNRLSDYLFLLARYYE
jgi:cob(I)alamin adenosyltransferase